MGSTSSRSHSGNVCLKSVGHGCLGAGMQGGLYCTYQRRQPGDLNYNVRNEGAYLNFTNVADCPNIVVRRSLLSQTLDSAIRLLPALCSGICPCIADLKVQFPMLRFSCCFISHFTTVRSLSEPGVISLHSAF